MGREQHATVRELLDRASNPRDGVEFLANFPLKRGRGGKYRILRRAAFENDVILEFESLDAIIDRFDER